MEIFITQYNYRNRYLVIIDGGVYVYKYDECKFDPPIPSFQAKNFFIGKSKLCPLTKFSGAGDKVGFDGNTLSLECENNEYVYISGLEIFKFKTEDKIVDYISLMSINMCPYANLIKEKYTYFIAHYYKFIENDKIDEGTLLNSLNPIAHHDEKCGEDYFRKLEHSLIHAFWPGHGEDQDQDQNEDEDDISDVEDEVEQDGDLIETQYLNGNDEVVKTFNQKCVICLERESY